jgi:hypothetical protein
VEPVTVPPVRRAASVTGLVPRQRGSLWRSTASAGEPATADDNTGPDRSSPGRPVERSDPTPPVERSDPTPPGAPARLPCGTAAQPLGTAANEPAGMPRVPARSVHPPMRPVHPTVPAPVDEPVSVVLVGAGGDSRSAVLTALLGEPLPVARPAESLMIVSYGPAARVAAFLPGWSQPWQVPARAAQPGTGLALPRPPRRIELSRPDQLLRHFSLVDTPDLDSLRSAGVSVLRDTMARGGALLFVIGAGPPPGPVAHELLRHAVAASVEMFFVVTPGGAQSEGELAHQAALRSAVPEVASAPWFVLDPVQVPALRRRLTDWAGREALHRAGAGLSALAGLHGPAAFDGIGLPGDRPPGADSADAVARTCAQPDGAGGMAQPDGAGGMAQPDGAGGMAQPDGAGGTAQAGGVGQVDWSARLDRTVQRAGQRVRQTVAIELARIHLAAVQEILFGGGPAVAPDFLDRELLALSLRATADCAAGVDDVVDVMIDLVFGAEALVTLRQPVRELLRRRILVDPPPATGSIGLLATAAGQVTRAAASNPGQPLGGVTTLGAGIDVFAAYPGPPSRSTVPPIGLALAADCWHPRSGPAGMAPDQARSWTQRMLRAMELELAREVAVRFAAVRRGLASLLADTIDGGDPRP